MELIYIFRYLFLVTFNLADWIIYEIWAIIWLSVYVNTNRQWTWCVTITSSGPVRTILLHTYTWHLAYPLSEWIPCIPGSSTSAKPAPPPPQPAVQQPAPKPAKPFAPLGNRKALVEKSGLVKHATSKKGVQRQSSTDSRTSTHR
jgi:hypothetical protein